MLANPKLLHFRAASRDHSSSIQFSKCENQEEAKKISISCVHDSPVSDNVCRKTIPKKKVLKPSLTSVQRIDYRQVGMLENKAYILATRSSLEMIKEKGSIKTRESGEENVEGNGENREEDNGEPSDEIRIMEEKGTELLGSQKRSYESVRIDPEKKEAEAGAVPKIISKDVPSEKGELNTKMSSKRAMCENRWALMAG